MRFFIIQYKLSSDTRDSREGVATWLQSSDEAKLLRSLKFYPHFICIDMRSPQLEELSCFVLSGILIIGSKIAKVQFKPGILHSYITEIRLCKFS